MGQYCWSSLQLFSPGGFSVKQAYMRGELSKRRSRHWGCVFLTEQHYFVEMFLLTGSTLTQNFDNLPKYSPAAEASLKTLNIASCGLLAVAHSVGKATKNLENIAVVLRVLEDFWKPDVPSTAIPHISGHDHTSPVTHHISKVIHHFSHLIQAPKCLVCTQLVMIVKHGHPA